MRICIKKNSGSGDVMTEQIAPKPEYFAPKTELLYGKRQEAGGKTKHG